MTGGFEQTEQGSSRVYSRHVASRNDAEKNTRGGGAGLKREDVWPNGVKSLHPRRFKPDKSYDHISNYLGSYGCGWLICHLSSVIQYDQGEISFISRQHTPFEAFGGYRPDAVISVSSGCRCRRC